MAEAFARAYGSGVIDAASAGLYPAFAIPRVTVDAMSAKHLDMRGQSPKHLREFDDSKFDLIINMSGAPLPGLTGAEVRAWNVPDPVALPYEGHCAVRDQIERLVMELILELRKPVPSFKGQGWAGKK